MSRKLLFVLSALWLLAGPALGQEDAMSPLLGMAAAQAPEAGLGVCFGPDKEAIGCAEAKCMEQSGLGPGDCQTNLWCFPAGWSADIFMMLADGPHWHEFQCGWQTREKLEAAIALMCEEEGLMECTAVGIWNPDGEEQLGTYEQ